MFNLLKDLKKSVKGKGLNLDGPKGILKDDEFNNIYHLFCTVCADKNFSKKFLLKRINEITENKAGYLEEFSFTSELLNFQSHLYFAWV